MKSLIETGDIFGWTLFWFGVALKTGELFFAGIGILIVNSLLMALCVMIKAKP